MMHTLEELQLLQLLYVSENDESSKKEVTFYGVGQGRGEGCGVEAE